MALREYKWRGSTWQFEDGDAPGDATPVTEAKRRKAPNKAAKPAYKAAKLADK
ncbi:MAG: hypothetical protein SPG07_09165 [Coriobacteriales bacterium]|nr:hypothetical protein [Coriobacteriales bacterium]